MADETVILPVKMSRKDRDALRETMGREANISELVRQLLRAHMQDRQVDFDGSLKRGRPVTEHDLASA